MPGNDELHSADLAARHLARMGCTTHRSGDLLTIAFVEQQTRTFTRCVSVVVMLWVGWHCDNQGIPGIPDSTSHALAIISYATAALTALGIALTHKLPARHRLAVHVTDPIIADINDHFERHPDARNQRYVERAIKRHRGTVRR